MSHSAPLPSDDTCPHQYHSQTNCWYSTSLSFTQHLHRCGSRILHTYPCASVSEVKSIDAIHLLWLWHVPPQEKPSIVQFYLFGFYTIVTLEVTALGYTLHVSRALTKGSRELGSFGNMSLLLIPELLLETICTLVITEDGVAKGWWEF